MESARPAAAADLADLVRLWRAAVTELGGQRGGPPLADTLTRQDLEGYLSGALQRSDHLVVVGLIERAPVGIASLRAAGTPRLPVGDLELIYVEPGARGVGVAAAMLSVVLDAAGEWGLDAIDAPALPGNRGAKSFFEAHGFTARLLIMRGRTRRSDG